MGDPPRLLHKNSQHGYTEQPHMALNHEPEAISADDLHRVALLARDREAHAWHTSRDRLRAELEHLRAHVHTPGLTRFARAVEREIAAFDRKPL